MSRGFLCTMFGLGMTASSWFTPWDWPAWPGFFVAQTFTPNFHEFGGGAKAAVLVALIAINSVTWAALAYATSVAATRLRESRRARSSR
jgi:hypothetical protein